MIRHNLSIKSIILLTLAIILSAPGSGSAATVYIPEELQPWKEWVMHDNERYVCPSLYNDSKTSRCIWPELLDLDFNTRGGTFRQKVTVLADSVFYLPGDQTIWPMSVMIGSNAVPVLPDNARPSISLDKGVHIITGKFYWKQMPQSFSIPETTGLVSLRINDTIIPEPFIDKAGRLWIQKKSSPATSDDDKNRNILNVSVFRLVDNKTPLEIRTLIRLTVSGEKRREKLLPCLPGDAPVISVKSPLPLKLIEDGSMLVDVSPGKWDIQFRSVINHPTPEIGPAVTPYGDEIWAFRESPELRITRVEGVMAIDPMQTTMPDSWKRYSSYLVTQDDTVRLVEIQRGRPDTMSDSLILYREMWLDFDGRGATVRDRITGTSGQRSFFGLDTGTYELGRVSTGGNDALVTLLDKNHSGIELERGRIDFTAVSRLNEFNSGDAFSLGWNKTFQKSKCRLNLPPGWRLMAVTGGTSPSDNTWVDQWSMLDFFLILVVSFAVARLWRWWWGIVFLSGFILIAHESWAPFYIWMILIITTSIFRITGIADSADNDSLRFKFLKGCHYTAMATLIVIALVFSANQIRTAVYPQLESTDRSFEKSVQYEPESPAPRSMNEAPPVEQMEMDSELAEIRIQKKAIHKPLKSIRKNKLEYSVRQQHIATQTGPGIPDWLWKSITIDSGLVQAFHPVGFYITSPIQNSIISIIRVVILMIMIFRFGNFRFPIGLKSESSSMAAHLVIPVIAVLIAGTSPARADVPPQDVLTELKQRLTEPADCFPDCASISRVNIRLPDHNSAPGGKQFSAIALTVHAAVDTVIPLPSGSGTWNLYDMSLDSVPHQAVRRENTLLWTHIPEGVHTLSLRGVGYNQKRFRFLFPLKPAYISVDGQGWSVSGINDNNQTDSIIQAVRTPGNTTGAPDSETNGFWKNSENVIADFVRVTRTLNLGMEWNVLTRVERFAPSEDQQNIVAIIPLLANELVRTDLKGLTIKDGMASLTMPPDVNRLEWSSSLPVTPEINLNLSADAKWSEIWQLNLDPSWHMESEGIPVTYPENSTGSFWYPWPGERVTLKFTKLVAAPGESVTIDSVRTDYHVGKGFNRIVLKTKIRTTRGRTHTVKSPPDSIIKHIKINNRKFPLSGSPETIALPLQPGTQTIEIEWHEAESWNSGWFSGFFSPKHLSVPVIDMGKNAANIDVYMHLPDKLWLLITNGPRLGPAVLAWSMAGVIILAALVLGRINLSPLSTLKWGILGLGMISLSIPEMLCVAGWFLAVNKRIKTTPVSSVLFNLMQAGLVVWTVSVILILLKAISHGLLQIPDMQVAGNGSEASLLHWTLDRSGTALPSPGVYVFSIYVYHIAMLIWALWLAINTVSWARLFVTAIKSGGIWRPVLPKRGKRKIVKQPPPL